jgi:peptidoglycan hydrolase-like protein with peptidoglycan-binding domain
MPSNRARHKSRREYLRRSARIGSGLVALTTAGLIAGPAVASAHTPMLTSLLEQGSVGPNVARVQHALHINDNSHFTRATKRAVIAFQRRDGLLVDGIVGPQTWGALFHIPETTTTSSSTSNTASQSQAASAQATSSSTSGGGYSIPSSIVQCESGGNYSAVNPQSGAGGAYQIMPSTWHDYGGQGLPQDAPKSEQDAIAAKIYSTVGPSAWVC